MKIKTLLEVIEVIETYIPGYESLLQDLRDELEDLNKYSRVKITSEVEDYNNLVGTISYYDKNAAEYMRTEAPKLESFKYTGRLESAFVWSDTPQGHVYWYKLNGVR